MAVWQIFSSLGCYTDSHAESRGWEKHKSTRISKVHSCGFQPYVFLCTGTFSYISKVWLNSGSIYNAVSYCNRLENF